MEIKDVLIRVIPHAEQRYNTVGDWLFHPSDPTTLLVNVSDTGDWKWNMCVALHELAEAIACTANGVTQEQVDEFDKNWKPGFGYEEPGEDPRSPYFQEHALALTEEQTLFFHMSSDYVTDNSEWELYEAKLEELMKSRE